MLDENLPTFRGRQSAENPLNTLYSFTHHGSTPSPEFLLRRPDPTLPEAKNKYAVALADPILNDVIYAEVLITPEWKQSSALDGVSGGTTDPTPPENINLQLYNPDQTVVLRQVPGSWGRGGSWDFELPTVSFKKPTTSQIDREAVAGPAARDLIPRLTFRWKRERLSKGMTCYLVGKTEDAGPGRRGTKEPDITVALAEQGRNGETLVALYEPNMRRVELEDRKGFDMLLLLSLEVIRDLFLNPKDPYNLDGRNGRGRRASQPVAGTALNSHPPFANTAPDAAEKRAEAGQPCKTPPPPKGSTPPTTTSSSVRPSTKSKTPPPIRQTQAEIDAETERLKAMVEQEERERQERERLRRKEREREEKRRQEEAERLKREREAEVERETERLRRLYGVEGQDFNQHSPIRPISPLEDETPTPFLPPRPVSMGPSQFQAQTQNLGQTPGQPRPLSAYQQHFSQPPPPGQAQGNSKPSNPFAAFSNKLENLPLAGQAASTVQGFLGKIKRDEKKTNKKTT
ncbi:hypothetical protein HOO65_020248 [Ceratocystis lukuohia]|uniref:Reticulocyte-binding protein 2 like protein a n=1 Tax=Ceratocystis lukuohia TaxID=2019550 RepID=A0ABR4MN73_9PEZI